MSDFYMDELAKYYRMQKKENLTIIRPLLLSGPKLRKSIVYKMFGIPQAIRKFREWSIQLSTNEQALLRGGGLLDIPLAWNPKGALLRVRST